MKKRMVSVLLVIALVLGFALPVMADSYVVQEGDVLWRIARDHGSGATWQEIAEYNGLRNPHLIFVGQELRIPILEDIPLTHTEVVVGADSRWPVGGTLSMPAGASARNPVPAVIIVHGSGPSDRDGYVYGALRPYYDIAEYLYENGVAVLRYDNRNLVHGLAMQEAYGSAFTVWEETIEPALYAAQLLRDDPRISQVFVLGHSLGGMLAPRIHAAGGDFDGLIMMAGSTRTLMDIILDQEWQLLEIAYMQVAFQTELLTTLVAEDDIDFLRNFFADVLDTSALSDDEMRELVTMVLNLLAAELDNLVTAVENAEILFAAIPYMNPEEAQATRINPALPIYAYYHRDIALHPAEAYIRDIDVPILVMQGGNDFQVFADIDFVILQDMLGDRENATFKLYQGLNHMFMPSQAENILEALAEYEVPQRVHPQVLRDIADWILAQR